VATAISQFNVDHAVAEFERYIRGANDVIHATSNLALSIGQKLGLNNVGEWFANTSVGKALGAHTLTSPEARMGGSAPAVPSYLQDYIKRTYGGGEPGAPEIKNKIDITQPQYKPLPTAVGGKGKHRSHRATADDRFAETIQDVKDRTAALKEEQATLGLSFEAQQKRKVALDLEQEALRQVREEARRKGDADWQNVQLSQKQKDAIDKVSDAYAKQADDLRKATEAQDLEADVLKGTLSDIRSAFEDGKITMQEWGQIGLDIIGKLADKIEDDLVQSILSANSAASGSGGGGGGFFGMLVSGLGSLLGGGVSLPATAPIPTPRPAFASGTNFAPGGPSIINERGGEVVDLPRGSRVIPHDVSMAMARNSGPQDVHVTVGVSVDKEGNLQAYVKDVAQGESARSLAAYRGSMAMTTDVAGHYTKAKSRRFIQP
jgi:hypothetical protein